MKPLKQFLREASARRGLSVKDFEEKYEWAIDKAFDHDDMDYFTERLDDPITPAIATSLLGDAIVHRAPAIFAELVEIYGAKVKKGMLAWAAGYGEFHITKYLIDAGLDVNEKDSNGRTGLEGLLWEQESILGEDTDDECWDDGYEIVKALIAAGAKKPDPSKFDLDTYTGRVVKAIASMK